MAGLYEASPASLRKYESLAMLPEDSVSLSPIRFIQNYAQTIHPAYARHQISHPGYFPDDCPFTFTTLFQTKNRPVRLLPGLKKGSPRKTTADLSQGERSFQVKGAVVRIRTTAPFFRTSVRPSGFIPHWDSKQRIFCIIIPIHVQKMIRMKKKNESLR